MDNQYYDRWKREVIAQLEVLPHIMKERELERLMREILDLIVTARRSFSR